MAGNEDARSGRGRLCSLRARVQKRMGRTTIDAGQRGQGMVEFALVLPVLVLLVAGAVDIGNGFQTYVALTNATREGAHYGVNHATDTGGICGRVQQVLPGRTVTCNVYYAVNSNGTCASGGAAAIGGPVCVSVSYNLTTLMGGVLGYGTIPITTRATMIVFNLSS